MVVVPAIERSDMGAETNTQTDAYTRAAEAIPSCAITEEDLKRQRERAAKLSRSVRDLTRHDEAVVFEFEAGFDRQALDELVAVERECCPFFTFGFDEEARRLTVGVQQADHVSALEAMAEQLGAKSLEG
jgi:hypothetical protein